MQMRRGSFLSKSSIGRSLNCNLLLARVINYLHNKITQFEDRVQYKQMNRFSDDLNVRITMTSDDRVLRGFVQQNLQTHPVAVQKSFSVWLQFLFQRKFILLMLWNYFTEVDKIEIVEVKSVRVEMFQRVFYMNDCALDFQKPKTENVKIFHWALLNFPHLGVFPDNLSIPSTSNAGMMLLKSLMSEP